MIFFMQRQVVLAFLFTAFLYLACVSYIDFPMTTILKPLPLLLLIFGVLRSDMIPWAKLITVIALCFSLIGDIVLTLSIPLQLELGIGCFLLTHLCYIFLFLKKQSFKWIAVLYYIPVILYSGCILYMLVPYLGALYLPVLVYFVVLLAMVFCALQVSRQKLLIGAGAISFLLSDSILAYSLFVLKDVDMRIIIMFDYYLAQFLIVMGLIGLYQLKIAFSLREKVPTGG